MKRVTAFFAFLLAAVVTASGQIMDPVSWSGTARQTAPGKYILSARADIEYPWHIYSLVLPDGGPMPTEFAFQGAGELFTLDGKTSEPVPEKSYDANFQMEIQWHSGVPVFTQQITVKDASVKSVTAEVTYMACDDTQCLAPETKTIVFQLPVTPDKPQEKKPAVKPSEKPTQLLKRLPSKRRLIIRHRMPEKRSWRFLRMAIRRTTRRWKCSRIRQKVIRLRGKLSLTEKTGRRQVMV